MAIYKELVASRVPVSTSATWVAEQRVWEPIKGSQLGLVALSTNVDDDALTAGGGTVMWNGHVDGGMVRRCVRSVGDVWLPQRRVKSGELEVNGA